MPIYEYRCTACSREFEELVRNAAEAEEVSCPACARREVERLLSRPAALGGAAGRGVPSCGPIG